MRAENTRLYRAGLFQRWISAAEAEQMLLDGSARDYYEACADGSARWRGVEVGRLARATPDYIASAETISFSEMLANVGIAGGVGEPPDALAVRAAQRKIKLYPFVGDSQAVLAR